MRAHVVTLIFAALASAHPPFDVPNNASDVLAASEAVVARMNETGCVATQWHVLSAQKQLVSGLNYFLVLAIAQVLPGALYPAWHLCSARVYTDFAGVPQQVMWTHESASAVAAVPTSAGECSAELAAPAPMQSSATVHVTLMTAGGGGMMGGGMMTMSSHDEFVVLRVAWRLCGSMLVQAATCLDRNNATLALPTHSAMVATAAPPPAAASPAAAAQGLGSGTCPPELVPGFLIGLAVAAALGGVGVCTRMYFVNQRARPTPSPSQSRPSPSWELNEAAVRAAQLESRS
jgi:hypothetical protein